jgi:predicted O-linked N-acetylglucosamine transferase (SPINDLY family)
MPPPENLPSPLRSDYHLPSDGFIFASFNNTYKINPLVLSCWSEILANTENSFLWTYIKHVEARENFIREAGCRGIRASQIIFADFAPYQEHLARHQLADLYLDTFPYNAGATAGNALKMGLPIVTLCGRSFPSRYSASLLESLQLSELICTTPGDYIRTAIALAKDRARLAEIKELLAENLKTSISFHPASFTRNLERAYTIAMDNYLNDKIDHIYT